MMAETKYPGFVITKKIIKPDDNKVEVIGSLQEPKTVRQVRGFIGAIGYYRRFKQTVVVTNTIATSTVNSSHTTLGSVTRHWKII